MPECHFYNKTHQTKLKKVLLKKYNVTSKICKKTHFTTLNIDSFFTSHQKLVEDLGI